jgi:ornithine decarboxylase
MVQPGVVEDVLKWAAEEQVDTPAFLLSPAALQAGVAQLRHGLGGRISYATKANAHPKVMEQLAPLVDEFNVTNLVHLDALLALGVEPSRISYLHPVSTPATVDAVAARGVTRFVVDDERGLRLLRAAGESARVETIRVTLRLRPPDIGESTRSVVRFGNTREVLRQLARAAADTGLHIEALSFFVGTAGGGMSEALPYRRGIEQLARLHEQLDRDGIGVPAVNIGGGFPGSRRTFHLRHPDFFPRIGQLLAEHFGPDVDVVSEPGRYLSEPSMAMLARVVADRTVAGRRLVYLDASAYGGLFESSFIEPGGSSLTIGLPSRQAPGTPAEVLGPIMDSFDVVKRNAALPPLHEGELLLLPNTGAYSWQYAARCEGVTDPAVVQLPDRLDPDYAAAWFD